MEYRDFSRISSLLLSGLLLYQGMAAPPPPGGGLTPPFSRFPSLAQEYLINAWDADRGLPHNSVTCITQARNGNSPGYLWVGTYNGLARFDGIHFTVFDQESTPGLRSDRILKLLYDRKGTLWIGTEGGGLSRYQDGQIERVALTREIGHSSVTGLTEDRDGAIWLGTSATEVHRYFNRELQTFGTAQGLPHEGSVSVLMDGDGILWAYTPDYLGYFDKGRFVACKEDPGSRIEVGQASDGGIWVAYKGRLQKYRRGQFTLDCGPISRFYFGFSVRALYEDRHGDVWVGTAGKGLYRYRDGNFQPITSRGGLSSDIVLSLFEDAERNLWVGTHSGGLDRVSERMFDAYDVANGLKDNNVISLSAGPRGIFWACTGEGGLNCLYRERWVEQTSLTNNDVCAVTVDKRGGLWVGSWGSGLFYHTNLAAAGTRLSNLTNLTFQNFRRGSNGLSSEIIRAIYEDHNGAMWFGTYDEGAMRYEDGRFTAFNRRDGLPHNDVRVILEDHAGCVWFGTGGGGLSCYTNKQFVNYRSQEGLPSEFIRALYEDQTGSLWIGTGGSGLCRLKAGKITTFGLGEGLVDETISQIFEDNRGYLWLGCNKGVMRIKRSELDGKAEGVADELSVVWYNQLDGMNRCNGGYQSSGCRMPDGRLWFPTVHGAAVVDPNNLRVNLRPPQVIIEDLSIDGASHDITERVMVPPGRERYDFHFTGLSYSAPERVRFRFKLEGLDKDWVEAGTRRVAYYSHLPPGRYRFLVNAANRDGIWTAQATVVRLTVLAPFWRTWWFGACSLLSMMIVVAAVARYLSMRRLEQKLALLRHQTAIERERARIAQDMHDDLGATLTQIALLSDLGQRQLGDSAASADVRSRLERISGKAREVVNSLDEIVWAVNPRNDTVRSLVEYLASYVDEYLEQTRIRCWQEVPEELPHDAIDAEARHNVYLVLKEALNNVAKHAAATEVWFKVRPVGRMLSITIEDNGRGFPSGEGRPGGNGLRNMERRIQEIGGCFTITSQPGKGVRLEFSVPFDRS